VWWLILKKAVIFETRSEYKYIFWYGYIYVNKYYYGGNIRKIKPVLI